MLVVAVLVGLQAAGKTTFRRQVLGAGYDVVSKADFARTRNRQRRQMRLIEEALSAGRSVVVDNTNPSPQEWSPLVEVARRHRARVVAYWFPPDLAASCRRNAARPDATRVPEVGLRATLARLQRPRPSDGFDDVFAVEFDGAGGFRVRTAGGLPGRRLRPGHVRDMNPFLNATAVEYPDRPPRCHLWRRGVEQFGSSLGS